MRDILILDEIITLSVGNYLSFKSKTTLSLEASSIKEHVDTNLISTKRYNLLRGAVIYGPNASGKSNLVKAMSTMRRMVLQSFEQSSADELNIIPFLLNTETEHSPSFFEAVFLIEGIRYRYGFEVDDRIIHSEWLLKLKSLLKNPYF